MADLLDTSFGNVEKAANSEASSKPYSAMFDEIAREREVSKNFAGNSMKVLGDVDSNSNLFFDPQEIETGISTSSSPEIVGALKVVAVGTDVLKRLSDDEPSFETAVSKADLDQYGLLEKSSKALISETAAGRSFLLKNFDEVNQPDHLGKKDDFLTDSELTEYLETHPELGPLKKELIEKVINNYDIIKINWRSNSGEIPYGLDEDSLTNPAPEDYRRISDLAQAEDLSIAVDGLSDLLRENGTELAKETLGMRIRTTNFSPEAKELAQKLQHALLDNDLRKFTDTLNRAKDDPAFPEALAALNKGLDKSYANMKIEILGDDSIVMYPFLNLNYNPRGGVSALLFGPDQTVKNEVINIDPQSQKIAVSPYPVALADPIAWFDRVSNGVKNEINLGRSLDVVDMMEQVSALRGEQAHIRAEELRLLQPE